MSKEDDERLREYPADRFDHPVLTFNLDELAETIEQEPISEDHTRQGHRQQQLYRFENLTHNLFAFEEGGSLPEHTVRDGSVTILVLEGRIRLETDDESYELGAGELLTMKPGIQHRPRALEASRMLVTIVRHPEIDSD